MKDLMKMLRKMDMKVYTIQSQFTELRFELQNLKNEMVTKQTFSVLDQRVQKLEEVISEHGVGCQIQQLSDLQKQLNRFDPANKSLVFGGFSSSSPDGRAANIRSFLESKFQVSPVQVEHIFQGAFGKRVIAPLSVVEFSCNSVREMIFRKLEHDKIKISEDDSIDISIRRAKTA